MCYNAGMMNVRRVCADVCREGSGARTFFTGILMWGVGMGCFNASFHNFIVDEYRIGGFDRGVLEFMREMPGVLLVCVLAAMSRFSDGIAARTSRRGRRMTSSSCW